MRGLSAHLTCSSCRPQADTAKEISALEEEANLPIEEVIRRMKERAGAAGGGSDDEEEAEDSGEEEEEEDDDDDPGFGRRASSEAPICAISGIAAKCW